MNVQVWVHLQLQQSANKVPNRYQLSLLNMVLGSTSPTERIQKTQECLLTYLLHTQLNNFVTSSPPALFNNGQVNLLKFPFYLVRSLLLLHKPIPHLVLESGRGDKLEFENNREAAKNILNCFKVYVSGFARNSRSVMGSLACD